MDVLGPTSRALAEPLIVAAPRRRHGVLARLRAAHLDAELARGCSPDDGGQRAARAAQLVRPRTRRRLARNWEEVLQRAARPHHPSDPRVPLSRERIRAVEPAVLELAARLRVAAPLPVQGVAMAHHLLTDGRGPLYARGSTAALADALEIVCRHLDPARALIG